MQDNPDIGFVQARWTFANAHESILTRVQVRRTQRNVLGVSGLETYLC